jgi:hypothetical protein
MTSEKNIKIKPNLTSDTELFYDLLADQSKLLPVKKIVQVSKSNHDRSDDSHIVDKASISSNSNLEINSSSHSVSNKEQRQEQKQDDVSSISDEKSNHEKYIESDIINKVNETEYETDNESVVSRSSTRSRKNKESHKKLDEIIASEKKITPLINPKQNEEKPKIEQTFPPTYVKSYSNDRETRFKKIQLLAKLSDIKKSGKELTKNYDINSDIIDIEDEVRFHVESQEKDASVETGKFLILGGCKCLEYVNNKFDPFGINLKGWHEQMSTNIDNYKLVLQELYEKYKDKVYKIEPEYKLAGMIFFSAASFHASKMLVEQLGIEKLIETNPELLQSIQANIASTLEKNMGKSNEKPVQNLNVPSNQDLYKQMMKEKQELENKISQNKSNNNDTINKMMAMQSQQKNKNIEPVGNNFSKTSGVPISNIDIKKPSNISDLLARFKNTENKELIPLEETNSTPTRIKITNTIESESQHETDNITSVSNMRRSRRQRPIVI